MRLADLWRMRLAFMGSRQFLRKYDQSGRFPSSKRSMWLGGWTGSALRRGFTLVELMAVMGIMGVLAVAVIPMTDALMVSGSLDRAVGDMTGTFEYARSYAMSNNTYVYVGLREESGAATGTAATDGVGRVVVAVIASSSGIRPDFSLWGTSALSAGMVPVAKPQVFEGVHLAPATQLVNGAQMTGRPVASVDLSSATATTSFQWPVAGTENNFVTVVEFDPHGVARLQAKTSYDTSISNFLEVPLLSAHGDQVASTAAQMANQAAIQVDGVTGQVRIYRP